ncbi:MAG: Fe(3+) ions import ATP-binding protein FbpC 2 [Alphaproteobacteria bacterium UBA4588]|nr:MAG: Fe(3+) ions import ATP-binding protein FbpC 2 [Alphaproteobacteria bacterium UBA4588]
MLSFRSVSHDYGESASVSNVSFDVGAGEVVTLLGPSGCGKTTLLRLAAGFEALSSGEIISEHRILSGAGVLVPPEDRKMGLVFQSYALFPHLTVNENVLFGLSHLGGAAEERAADMLAEFDVLALAQKYPHELSGGQQQRVALARALAPSPKLVLLDEPYSGLDTRLRERVRDRMLHILRETGTSALMVTHDAEEAMFMSDRIIVLDNGIILQQGRPIDLYCRPQNAFVTEFFGEVNHVPAHGLKGRVSTLFGEFDSPEMTEGCAALMVIRHEGLRISATDSGVPATVVESHLLGRATLIHLAVPSDDGELHLHARIPGLNSFAPGSAVHLEMDREQAFFFAR